MSDDFDDGKGQMTGRNGAPSEYLLSLPGTRPLSARYLSATCSVWNRTNTEQVMHMCRTRTMANRCQLFGYTLYVRFVHKPSLT